MKMFLLIAARNLIQARRRTLLIGSALAVVTMLLVLLLSLSRGLTETMLRSATTLSTGHLNVSGWYKAKPADAAPILSETPALRKIVEESTPDIAFAVDRARGWGRVVSESGAVQAALAGIDLDEEKRFLETIQLAEERDYKKDGRAQIVGDINKLREPGTILIFAAQAERLGVGVGDQLTIVIETFSGARNTSDVTVVAVAKDFGLMSNWNMFLPKSAVRELYQLKDDTSGAIMMHLHDIDRADAAVQHLRTVLKEKGYTVMEHDPQPFWMKFETVAGEDWVGQRVDVTLWRDEVSFLLWVLTALDSITAVLLTILVVIIVIGIMNSMWISVRERTNEVGTLRAIGMARWRVLAMFMTEAILLGIAATSTGAAIGAGIATALDAATIQIPIEAVQAILMSDTLHLAVGFGELAMAVALFTTITAAAAFLPAFRAAHLQPVTAIQSAT